MGRKISTYANDVVVTGVDQFIGTDRNNGNVTRNFTPDDLSLYYIQNGFVEPSRAGLVFTYKSFPTQDIKGLFNLRANQGSGGMTAISLDGTLSEIIVSNLDNNRTNVRPILNYLVGHDIKIINPAREQASNYALYTVDAITDFGTDYAALELTFISGNADAELTVGSTVTLSSIGGGANQGSTVRPNRIFSGTGAPDDNTNTAGSRNGDFYVDTSTTTWYGPKAGTWPAGTSLIGPAGAMGIHGDSIDISVTDNRSQPSGAYEITITQTEYDSDNTPTTSDVVRDLNIIGPPGLQGPAGSRILTGVGVPDASLGVNGDFYIDTNAPFNMYGPKTNGVWSLVGRLQGQDGERGQQGMQGDMGADGPEGPRGQFDLEIYRLVAEGTDITGDTVTTGDYTISTDTIANIPTPWVRDIPVVTAGMDLWEVRARILPVSGTDAYTPTWSPPFRAGAQGPAGPMGNRGLPGDSYNNITVEGTPTQGQPLRITFINTNPSNNVNIDIPAGNDGTDGRGWTGGSYDAATGVVRFESTDGLAFQTEDLRGTSGEVTNTVVQVHRNGSDMGDTGAIVDGQIRLDLTAHIPDTGGDAPAPELSASPSASQEFTGSNLSYVITASDVHSAYSYTIRSARRLSGSTNFRVNPGVTDGDANFTVVATAAGSATFRAILNATHTSDGSTTMAHADITLTASTPVPTFTAGTLTGLTSTPTANQINGATTTTHNFVNGTSVRFTAGDATTYLFVRIPMTLIDNQDFTENTDKWEFTNRAGFAFPFDRDATDSLTIGSDLVLFQAINMTEVFTLRDIE